MAEVIIMHDYVVEKLKEAEAEHSEAMALAVKFDDEGKKQFSREMVERAKASRKKIDRLRSKLPKVEKKKQAYTITASEFHYQQFGRPKVEFTSSVNYSNYLPPEPEKT